MVRNQSGFPTFYQLLLKLPKVERDERKRCQEMKENKESIITGYFFHFLNCQDFRNLEIDFKLNLNKCF